MVTRNISPAPSASLAVMTGAWRQMKPRFWKYSWTMKNMALRTRNTAPKVLERTRRWEISRRNSKPWRFFCSGKSGAAVCTAVTTSACISTACPLPWDSTMVPETITLEPVVMWGISL